MRLRRGGLWTNRDFTQLWASETVSQIGAQITVIALPLLAALTLDASAAQMGILTAAGTAVLVWAPPGRALGLAVAVPVGWYVLGTVAPASGPVATVAEAWWEHPWPVAAGAVALCVLGRSR